MFHAAAVASATPAVRTFSGAMGDTFRWGRLGREALSLLSLPLLRSGQGIDGLEVSDSTFEEWEAVQEQFNARVQVGSVNLL